MALAASRVGVYFNPIPILPLVAPLPCPAVVTVHDLHELRPRWSYYRRLVGRTFARARAVICVSEATLAEVVEEFPWVESKAVVVREAADDSVYFPATAGSPTILAELGVTTAPLLAVGTLQPRKNYLRLIRGYAKLGPEAPPLVIVGAPGWEFEDIQRLPAELGIAGRVVFTGHLPEPRLGDLMRASLALCAVSTAEGFGLPLVEAMFCGLPILASDIPPFREVAGNAARFVNPLDEAAITAGLRRLLDEPELRLELSRTGLGRRGLFDWGRAAAEMVQVLKRAAET
jgi:glycosyltransferase involved in cell wall biosynthesis